MSITVTESMRVTGSMNHSHFTVLFELPLQAVRTGPDAINSMLRSVELKSKKSPLDAADVKPSETFHSLVPEDKKDLVKKLLAKQEHRAQQRELQ